MSLADISPWFYSIMFGIMAILIIGNNIWHALKAIIKNESTSFTLLLGSIFAVIAILIAPLPNPKWYLILVTIIDPGGAWSIYTIIKERLSAQ